MELAVLKTGAAMEARLITRVMRDLNVKARVTTENVHIHGGSHISYDLEVEPGTSVSKVEKCLPDLRVALTRFRNDENLNIRWRQELLRLEVPHPAPQPLRIGDKLKSKSGWMLAGRDYNGSTPRDSYVKLDEVVHILVAGASGSGKSTLMRSMLSTLVLGTSPDDLLLFLVDAKNEDLRPFKRLPHVVDSAWNKREAGRVIRKVAAIVEERTALGEAVVDEPRVVLVIDEFAELPEDDVLLLESVLGIGRSKRVTVIAATQTPTKEVMGKLGKPNFTLRFAGRVTSATDAYTATGWKASGAETLPGNGAFLCVDKNITRIQAYFFDTATTVRCVEAACQKWAPVDATLPVTKTFVAGDKAVMTTVTGSDEAVMRPVIEAVTGGLSPVTSGDITGDEGGDGPYMVENWPKRPENVYVSPSPVMPSPIPSLAVMARPDRALVPGRADVRFPIVGTRELTAAEAAVAREMYRDGAGMSLTALCKEVFGGDKNRDRFARLKRALGIDQEVVDE